MPQTDFETQLQHLVNRAIKADSHEVDLMPGVRRRLAEKPVAQPWRMGMSARAVISVAALIALFVGTFAVARPYLHGAATKPLPTIAPLNLRFYIVNSYADATRTVVVYTMYGAGETVLADAVLVDSNGHQFFTLDTGAGNSLDGYDHTRGVSYESAVYNPLPSNELGSPQTLTLRINQLVEGIIHTSGHWETTFTLTPHAAHTLALHAAPEIHGGISIQPTRIDIAPNTIQFDHQPGGIRLALHITGLRPDTSAFGLVFSSFTASYHWYMTTNISGSFPAAPSQHEGLLRLTLPDGTTLVPSLIYASQYQLNQVDAYPWQSIGPNGVTDVEVMFVTPLTHLTGTATLSLDKMCDPSVHGQQPDGSNSAPICAAGPWTFSIPLS